MESILTSIKKMLGISDWDTHFDPDIIMHINTVFMVLNQLGVGPEQCFRIEDNTSTWEDFIGDNPNIEAIKTYIWLRVRLLFDPPANSSITQSINQAISEYEWRLNVMVDTGTI